MRKARYSITVKSISAVVFWLVLFALIVINLGYVGQRESLVRLYTDGAFRVADIAALDIDADGLDALCEGGGASAEYRAAWNRMDALCNLTEMTFIYVIRPDTRDYGHITFLFSTVLAGSGYAPYDVGYLRETTNDEYRRKYRALWEGESDREFLLRDAGGNAVDHITAMVPLRGADGAARAILCVQQQMDAILPSRGRYVRDVMLGLGLLILLVILGQSHYLGRVLLRPIKRISDEANRFADENQPPRRKLGEVVKNRDEIGLLADSIDRMEAQVGRYVADITRITAERERINAELSLAEDIQTAMLPHDFPPFPERTEFELYAAMDPAREVGGDFYDFFLIDDDRLGLVIADVSGKGVPAALFMTMSRIVLQNCVKMGLGPAKALEKANEILCVNNQTQMFVTVWLGVLEISTGRMVAANAGHEYPAIRRAGGEFELMREKHGFVVGSMEGMKYRDYEVQLNPGDAWFVYTDGLPEATDAGENQFGTDRMLSALNGAPGAGPEALMQNVRRAVDRFVGDAEQFDDLTMLCLLYKSVSHKI